MLVSNQLNKQENYDKYRVAGEITAKVLDFVVNALKPGVSPRTLCNLSDMMILRELQKVYVKKKLKNSKGIAFPTCISINNMVGFHLPPKNIKLQDGDIVKIELGVHIDGFPACVCYTVILMTDKVKQDQKRNNVFRAVAEASKTALSFLKPGKKNTNMVKEIKKISKKHGCNLLYVNNINKVAPGVVSYQMSQNTIDGKNDLEGDDVHTMVINNVRPDYEYGMSEVEFLENEVFAIDIAMSTGSGKINYGDVQADIFKRNRAKSRSLKLKSSRRLLNSLQDIHFPVTTNQLCEKSSVATVKVGIMDCIRNDLLVPYYPYYAEKDAYVVRVKFTAIVRKKPKLIAGRSMNEQLEKLIDPSKIVVPSTILDSVISKD